MIESKNVIKGLKTIKQFFEYGLPSTAEIFDLYYGILNDAISLLKEQEAVEPKKTAYQRVDHTIAYRYRCGTCDMSIFPSYKYCPFCGQAVKWE